nr:MAG TPA: hypothetical protein [Caudoviricetes sp.]
MPAWRAVRAVGGVLGPARYSGIGGPVLGRLRGCGGLSRACAYARACACARMGAECRSLYTRSMT